MSQTKTSPAAMMAHAVVNAPMPQPAPEKEIQQHLHDIQGNIFGGFNKDYQTLLFLNFSDAAIARRWIGSIACEIATSAEVLQFNHLFKALNGRRGGELGILKATWTNIAFTYAGLEYLGVDGLAAFPKDGAFRQGMAARARMLGDMGDSAPEHWIGHLGKQEIHAVLIVASDAQSDLHTQVARYVQNMTATGGVEVVFLQEGAVRADQPGHEHFGFKDGVSQPGLRGLDTTQPGADPGQGNPGQDLLWPGEFVLGHYTQKAQAKPGEDGPNPDPGPKSASGPDWTHNGSYLVFRRLAQDVEAFHQYVGAAAAQNGITPELLGAKLVGRYASGSPVEILKDPTKRTGNPDVDDPAKIDARCAEDPLYNNDFEFGDDPDGQHCPLSSHIRKAYPRDEVVPGKDAHSSEADTQTHRLLRRGIPFGTSFRPSLGAQSHAGAATLYPDDRGLLFLCYQSSLERQFEFVQQNWVNAADFPRPGSGQDPIITPRAASDSVGPMSIPQCPHLKQVSHFVTTTGGEYFFTPSIKALNTVIGKTGA